MKNYTKRIILTRRDAVILLLALAVFLICAVILCGKGSGFGRSEIIDVSTLDGRREYLSSLGWEISAETEEIQSILLPSEFDGSMKSYVEMQTDQGYDFSSFCGTECTKYTYAVTNYPYDGTVYAVLYIYGHRVIGGDIHSAELNGFMHGIK